MMAVRSIGRRLALPVFLLISWVWLVLLAVSALLGQPVYRHHLESAGIAFGIALMAFVASGPWERITVGRGGARGTIIAVLLPAVAALLAFSWSVGLGPLSDDFVLSSWASTGNFAPREWAALRPLPIAMWHWVLALGGGMAALHAVNVTVHAMNSALVGVLAGTFARWRGATIAGVAFAVFPASTEAIAWTAGVFDVTATFFILSCVVLFLRSSGPITAWLSVLACAAAVLCKETAVVLPAILVAVLAVIQSMPEGVRRRWLVVAGCTVVSLLVVGPRFLWSHSLVEHLAAVPADRREWKDLIVRPFAALASPVRTDAGVTAAAYIYGILLLVLLASLLWRIWLRRGSTASVTAEHAPSAALVLGIIWALAGAMPLLKQFYVAPDLQGGRYLYLPSVGLALILGSAAETAMRWRLLPGLCVLALLVLYAHGLRTERAVWRTAAEQRDRLLSSAEAVVVETPCRELEVIGAPDNFRGAYVFREGLAQALARLPYRADGEACVAAWDGSVLVPSIAGATGQ